MSREVLLYGGGAWQALGCPFGELPRAARSSAFPPVMMGILRESFLLRLGDEDLVIDRGGGDENLRVALGDLGGSPYKSLLF